MARSCSIRETRESLAQIVDEVEAGAEVAITRHGKTVAVIIGPAALEALREEGSGGFAGAYDRFLRTVDLGRDGAARDVFEEVRERPAFRGAVR
ncbi:MAG TPA: type II toxin-antitoxin system Phd/YefM family antitoxin [Polyangiaceae bacterium]